MEPNPRYKICVSGAAETSSCGPDAFRVAEDVGREIAKHNCVLVDGATTGFPFWSAKGCKEAGGLVVGFSPAATEKDHINVYKLTSGYHDIIVYMGFNSYWKILLLTRE